jgi:long-chain acyl-CoA synthetase
MSTIVQLAADAARRFGDSAKVHVPNGASFVPVTTSEVARRRREVSAALRARGVSKGDRVAVIADTRLEWTIADLAILSIGAVTVGVYPSSTPAQMRFILEHARCRVAFVGGDGPRAALASIVAGDAPLSALSLVIDFDDAPARDAIAFTRFRDEGRAHSALRDTDDTGIVGPDDVATIVYTSGTTGQPKGVVLTHGALFLASLTGITALGVGATDVGVGFLPLAHVLARVNFYASLHTGASMWFAKSMEEVADVWRAAHPTVLALVPRVLEKIQARILAAVASSPMPRQKLFARALEIGTARAELLDRGAPIPRVLAAEHALWERLVYQRVRAGLGWDRLRFALSGGAPLRRDVALFFRAIGAVILEGYGLTETSAASVLSLPSATRIGSVGRALPTVEMRIADDGEILLKGPGLFVRYEGDDHATREAFDDNGFFRTGDVGVLDGDGFLRITDRKKDLVVTAGGKNVAPQSIEAALLSDVRLVQAIVLGDARPYLVALLVVDPAVASSPAARERIAAEAVAHANLSLARFEQVKRWAVLEDELTVAGGLLTPTQKVRRRAVTEQYRATIDALYADQGIAAH